VGFEFKERYLYGRVSRKRFLFSFFPGYHRAGEGIKIEFRTANSSDEKFFTFVSYQKNSFFSPYKVTDVVD